MDISIILEKLKYLNEFESKTGISVIDDKEIELSIQESYKTALEHLFKEKYSSDIILSMDKIDVNLSLDDNLDIIEKRIITQHDSIETYIILQFLKCLKIIETSLQYKNDNTVLFNSNIKIDNRHLLQFLCKAICMILYKKFNSELMVKRLSERVINEIGTVRVEFDVFTITVLETSAKIEFCNKSDFEKIKKYIIEKCEVANILEAKTYEENI